MNNSFLFIICMFFITFGSILFIWIKEKLHIVKLRKAINGIAKNI